MQYRVLDRQTLNWVDSGYCFVDSNHTINNDYIVMNNSLIGIVSDTNARQGDLIALIEYSGARIIGCITAVDNEAKTISFKDCKEFFNDTILNPIRFNYLDAEDAITYKYNAIEQTAQLIKYWWVTGQTYSDSQRTMPLIFEISGTKTALWTYEDDGLDFATYLQDIFNNYNIVLQFRVDFSDSTQSYLIVKIIANNNSGEVIKDNIKLQTITATEETIPNKTVAIVIDKDTKEVVQVQDYEDETVNAIYYLLDDNTIILQSTYNKLGYTNRVLPVKTIILTYDSGNTDGVLPIEVAGDELLGELYNHYIEAEIDRDSMLLDYKKLMIGDSVKYILENGTVDTIYTGYKDKDNGKVTMIFGKARKNYTDKIQLLLRKTR